MFTFLHWHHRYFPKQKMLLGILKDNTTRVKSWLISQMSKVTTIVRNKRLTHNKTPIKVSNIAFDFDLDNNANISQQRGIIIFRYTRISQEWNKFRRKRDVISHTI